MSTKLAQGIIKKTSAYVADIDSVVRREGWNVRVDFGDIEELKQSIRSNGFWQHKPLVVKRNDAGALEIVDGERRFTALIDLVREGGYDKGLGVPVVLADRSMTDEQGYVLMFTANSGKSFLPIEEAEAYRRMVSGGMTIADICSRVGRSEVHVRDRMLLLDADPEVKKALAEGKIGSTLAENIVKTTKGDADEQKKLVKKASDSKEGKREVTRRVQKQVDCESPVAISQRWNEAEQVFKSAVVKYGYDPEALPKDFYRDDDHQTLAYLQGVRDALRAVMKR